MFCFRYVDGDMRNDIGLVYLEEPLDIEPLKLCKRSYFGAPSPLAACGMGKVSKDGVKSDFLREVLQFETYYCEKDPGDRELLICPTSPSGGICQGDSGSPLYPLQGKKPLCLYGVVVSGDCVNTGVFTRVTGYSDWIYTTMKVVTKFVRNELHQITADSNFV